MNKRERKMVEWNYNAYRFSARYSCLWEVYGSHSERKDRAYDGWKTYLYKEGWKAHNYRILSHNSQIFTFGCMGYDPENGQEVFIYITPSYMRVADVDENGNLNNFRYA